MNCRRFLVFDFSCFHEKYIEYHQNSSNIIQKNENSRLLIMYSNPWGSEFGTWHLSLTKCQIIILFSSFEFENRSHGGTPKFDVDKWGVMRFSHRKVTFEMLENPEMLEIRVCMTKSTSDGTQIERKK